VSVPGVFPAETPIRFFLEPSEDVSCDWENSGRRRPSPCLARDGVRHRSELTFAFQNSMWFGVMRTIANELQD
jgi:hypothetical protein